MRIALLTLLLTAGMALAGQLEIGSRIVTRKDSLRAVLKLTKALKGAGRLKLTWTDTYGRTVAAEEKPVKVNGREVAVVLPLARAAAMVNFLAAELTVGETTVRAPKAQFVVTPTDTKWDDYKIFMYYAYKTAAQQRALRGLGITSGQLQSGRTQTPTGGRTWWQHDYRYYCDQINHRYLAAYHSPAYTPKHLKHQQAEAAYRKDRTSVEPFKRKPCFHDVKARAAAMARQRRAVQTQMRFKPFMYGTDECGTGNLVEAIDLCFDGRTLKAFRKWLIEQYGSLAAINKQWGTDFKKLSDVVPFTTDQMMARGDDNLSPWADHRHFMNKVFADVLKEGCDVMKEVDGEAIGGIVGAQMPSAFGGYDYWLLSEALDCIEPYNIGNNREIWRSLVPDKPAVTTAFGFGNMEVWRLWHQFLHGDQGIIIYDEKHRYLTADAKPTKLGADIAPTYRELTGGLCKQLKHMKGINDPVAIHYSHPSITAHWMFEVRPRGKNWINRGSASERKDSDFLRLRQSAIHLLEDNQLQYYFASYGQLENGAFDKMDAKVLILPQSVAMSKAECDAVRRFVKRGGTVVADCRTALMDEHCKMLPKGQLDDLFGIERTDTKFAPGKSGLKAAPAVSPHILLAGLPKDLRAAEPGVKAELAAALYQDANGTPAVIVREHGKGRTIYLNAVITDYHRWRLQPPQGKLLRELIAKICRLADVKGQHKVEFVKGGEPQGVELQTWQSGKLGMLSLHRNYQLRVSELGPPQYHSQKVLERPMKLTVDLGKAHAVYDQRAGKYLGKKRNVTFDLPRYEPVMLSILPEPVEGLTITAPAGAKRGGLLKVKLALKGEALGDAHAFRVRVIGPDGKELPPLTRTLAAPKGQVAWDVPIAVSDPAGSYTLVVRDIATGTSARQKLDVR